MPEDIKKIFVLCFRVSAAEESYQKVKDKNLSGLGRFIREGAWVHGVTGFAETEALVATLLTGASPATHGFVRAGDRSRAEYIWEAVQRSSKKVALFGIQVDRPPTLAFPPADPPSISSFLKTSPDWDICFVWLSDQGFKKPVAVEVLDPALFEILSLADPETLSVAIGLPEEGGGNGFIALAGQGVKKGVFLRRTARLEDVVPTLCYLGELSAPADCEGGIIYQALEDPDMKIKELRACRRNYERLRRSSGRPSMC